MPTSATVDSEPVALSRAFTRAFEFACAAHGSQSRKGTNVPYAAHLLGVASLVLDGGGGEQEAIAALLHDTLEDTDTTQKQLRKRFGRTVARIVVGCTDLPVAESRKKRARGADNWRARKTRSIEHLADPATPVSVLRVRAADALHNARSTVADLRRFGPEAWSRFNAGAVDQLWYYRSLSIVLSVRLPGLLSDELRVAVRELERVAGWWFDVGDPQAGGD
jgi:(p)ppGpp synthase/HD superfamily hydrolase